MSKCNIAIGIFSCRKPWINKLLKRFPIFLIFFLLTYSRSCPPMRGESTCHLRHFCCRAQLPGNSVVTKGEAEELKKKREEEADENEKRRGKSALFLSLSLYYSCAFPLATHLISSCAVRGRKKRRRNRDMREREGRRMRVCSMLFFTFQQKGGARERA